jgi:replicative DNA helicase
VSLDAGMIDASAAERAVLATMHDMPEQYIPRAMSILSAEDFRLPLHRWLFEVLVKMHGVSLAGHEVLKQEAAIESRNWYDVVTIITESPLFGQAFESTCGVVREASRKRTIASACRAALESVHDGGAAIDVAAQLSAAVMTFAAPENKRSRPIEFVVADAVAKFDEMAARGEDGYIPTGIEKIDSQVGGVMRDVLTVIAAPTSHAKTALALCVAENIGHFRRDASVGFFSLEMSDRLVSKRILARLTRIPLDRIQRWRWLSDEERARIDKAKASLKGAKFSFAKNLRSVEEICADARRLHGEGKLDIAIVDYLQLVSGKDERTREQEVNRVAWRLFELAQDLGIAMVALSQVTDDVQHRRSGRLLLSDLRDAKAIGHHARAVWMFQRPWQWTKGVGTEAAQCETLLQIEKQGEGKTGDLRLHFDGEVQEFSDEVEWPCDACGGGARTWRPTLMP